MSESLNIVFAGTPEFAAEHLRTLINSKHNVIAVYTQPDRPAGRGKKLMPSAVKQLALAHNIVVEQPKNFKQETDISTLATYDADVMVVVAYGLLLPLEVLELPKFGCLNVHGSLLPKWRGAAPIQRALEAGDAETGVTIMQMDIGLDTGDMLKKIITPITPRDTSATLYEKMMQSGPVALLSTLDDISNGELQREQQNDDDATYAKKLEKAEAKLDWSLPSEELDLKIRAFSPWPGTHTLLSDQVIKIKQATPTSVQHNAQAGTVLNFDKTTLEVACGEGSMHLKLVQLPGKKAMSVADLFNGYGEMFKAGTVLT